MCRLTGYVGRPIPAASLLFSGEHSLLRQSWRPREMISGSVNADGWGVAWWDRDRVIRLARAEPVWYDASIEALLGSIEASTVLAALRNTTPGLAVDASSVPPIVLDRWAFVLNGFVPAFRSTHMRSLRSMLPDELYAELRGSSDTETLFLLAVDRLRRGAELGEALLAVREAVWARLAAEPSGECQLTMVVSDGEEIGALRTSNVARSNSLHVAQGAAMAPDGILLASEPLDDDPAWRPIPDEGLVTITRQSLRIVDSR